MAGRKLLKEGIEAISQFALPKVEKKIRAYHGSPHSFEPEPDAPLGRFKDEAIGSGEGAQVYGRGHYFAENEDTAQAYRNTLTRRRNQTLNYEGKPVGQDTPYEVRGALDWLSEGPKQGESTADFLARRANELERHGQFMRNSRNTADHSAADMYFHGAERIRALDPTKLTPAGSTYEVNINADPERFLDWDKPVAEQPHIQQALEQYKAQREAEIRARMGADDVIWRQPGGDAEVNLSQMGEDERRIAEATLQKMQYGKIQPRWQHDVFSEMPSLIEPSTIVSSGHEDVLKQAGIPGIKYLDQGSRGAGEGTRNYVVFDPKIIEIIKKYGIAGALGAGLISPDDAKAAEQQGLGNPASASEGPEGTFSTEKTDRLPAASPVAERQDRLPVQNSDWVPGKRGTPPNPFPTDEELWSSQPANALSHLRNAVESVGGIGGDMSFTIPGTDVKLPLSANVLPGSEDVGKYTDTQVDKLRPDLAKTINDYTRNPSQDAGSKLLGEGIEWGVDPMDWFPGTAALGALSKARKLF